MFEDLNANGVQDTDEAGIPNSVIVLEGADIVTPLLTIENPTPGPEALDNFGFAIAGRGNDVIVGAPWEDSHGTNAGAA